MTFYITLIRDQSREPLHFRTEASSAHEAVRLVGAYCKGLFEGSGSGAEISSVSKTKSRGVEYRGL